MWQVDRLLYKVHPLLTSLLSCLQAIPKDKFCVDEQVVLFKRKSGIKQYNPNKPKPQVYKIFALIYSNGLAYNFEVYTGLIFPLDGIPDIGASSNIVLQLVSKIPGNISHKLFSDNWFCNVNLQATLQKRKIHCGGMVQQNHLAGCS